MKIRTFFSLSQSFVVAGAITATLYFTDGKLRSSRVIEADLLLTEQITSQIETLSLYAKSIQEPDPISWATQFLSVGPEQRPVSIWTFNSKNIGEENEQFRFQPKSGIFSYSKVLTPETGSGIKLQFHHGYVGFLGTTTRWVSDLLLLLVGVITFFFISTVLAKSKKQQPNKAGVDLKTEIESWLEQAKPTLVLVGLHIKNMIKEAKILTEFAAKSKNAIEIIRSRNTEISKIVLELEKSLSNSFETHDHLQIRQLAAALKKELEQGDLDTKAVLRFSDESFKATHEMSGHITKTTETITINARMLQNLRERTQKTQL